MSIAPSSLLEYAAVALATIDTFLTQDTSAGGVLFLDRTGARGFKWR
jgi:hypothetical protein